MRAWGEDPKKHFNERRSTDTRPRETAVADTKAREKKHENAAAPKCDSKLVFSSRVALQPAEDELREDGAAVADRPASSERGDLGRVATGAWGGRR